MVKIRLTRMGAHKQPFYRIIVADSKARRDGPFIEILGTYDPKKEPSEIKVSKERAQFWLNQGAQPTDTVKRLLQKAGA
ncbi:MAG: 30S ribosomal protein S16 [Nitrospirae bacterium]|nr:30S ribosomal protein S16 [Nitrospirota bacterium]